MQQALGIERLHSAQLKLCKLVASGQTRSDNIFPVVEDILLTSDDLVSRYGKIDVRKLVQENCFLGLSGISAIIGAMGILEKYGKNLLRPDPPPQWRIVRFSNAIFHTKVDNVKGARDILVLMGYTETVYDGLAYPKSAALPDRNEAINVTADIILLKYEAALLQKAQHPKPYDFFPYIPGLREIYANSPDLTNLETSRPLFTYGSATSVTNKDVNSRPQSASKTDRPDSNSFALSHNAYNKFENTSIAIPSSQPSALGDVPSTSGLSNGHFDEMCVVCGQKPAEVQCQVCHKAQCENCDKIWHQYPNRVSHQRSRIRPPASTVANHPLSTSVDVCIRAGKAPGFHNEPSSSSVTVKKSDSSPVIDWQIQIPVKIEELRSIDNADSRRKSIQSFCSEIEEQIVKFNDGAKRLPPTVSRHLRERAKFLQKKKSEIEKLFEKDLKRSEEAIEPVPIQPVNLQTAILTPVTSMVDTDGAPVFPPRDILEQGMPTESSTVSFASETSCLPGEEITKSSSSTFLQDVNISVPFYRPPVESLLNSLSLHSPVSRDSEDFSGKVVFTPQRKNLEQSSEFEAIQNVTLTAFDSDKTNLSNGDGVDPANDPVRLSDPVVSYIQSPQSDTVNGFENSVHDNSPSPVHGNGSSFSPRNLEEILRDTKQEDNRLKNIEMIDRIRAAENQQFTTRHVEIAAKELAETNDSSSTLSQWLSENWQSRVETVVNESNLPVSVREASDALLKAGGDHSLALFFVAKERANKMKQISLPQFFTDEQIQLSLFEAEGDCEVALNALQQPLLKSFVDRLKLKSSSRQDNVKVKDFLPIRSDRDHLQDAIIAMFDIDNHLTSDMTCKLIQSTDLTEFLSDYEMEDVLEAAKCFPDDFNKAVKFLSNKCMLCFDLFPQNKVKCMPTCGDNGCMYCEACQAKYLHVKISEGQVRDLVCPVCKLPDIDGDQEVVMNHLMYVEHTVRTHLNNEDYELYQKKVIDHTVRKMPNFRWCSHCPNGFEHNQNILKMVCSACNKATCFNCKRPWESQHEGLTCHDFLEWKQLNDADFQTAGLAAHLKENGINCPECKFRYALAKGGCMHFKCLMCSYQFCSGCKQPFKQGRICSIQPQCSGKGLHAHHPRDCFFYLRDFDVDRLQKILLDAGVNFDTSSEKKINYCKVEEQKETSTGLEDGFCGREVLQDNADLCVLHYKEYLVNLINDTNLDPASVFTVEELKTVLTRSSKPLPLWQPQSSDDEHRLTLLESVRELPLIQDLTIAGQAMQANRAAENALPVVAQSSASD
ncbi:E3 ubiquitin-protein ligase RNF31-like [Clavelina lepadiformis]